jgi:sulfhydrogenase subunit delta
MAKKIRVGWFTFTCCEDSTIIFTELMNQYYPEWFARIDFVHARIFKRDISDDIKPMDVAFIEGAISSDEQEKRLKAIRNKSRFVIAIGSCAILGSPSNQRNFFNTKQQSEIQPILDKFAYKSKVMKLSDIIKVDENVPGCPMNEQTFLDIFYKYIYASSRLRL